MSPTASPPLETWFTIEEAAHLCKRTPKTIKNLVSEHGLPRKLGWMIRHRQHRRRILLSNATVTYLQRLTIDGAPPETLIKPRH